MRDDKDKFRMHKGKATERWPIIWLLLGIPGLPPMNLYSDCNTSDTTESQVLTISILNPFLLSLVTRPCLL